jgi:hypothetical protein
MSSSVLRAKDDKSGDYPNLIMTPMARCGML